MTSTVFFKNKPSVIATSTVGGPKEGEGQLGRFIEKISEDDTFGEKTYEKAECKMISFVIDNVIKNAKMKESDINAIISGDLLNQIISSSFSARKFDIPYLGIYNAFSLPSISAEPLNGTINSADSAALFSESEI